MAVEKNISIAVEKRNRWYIYNALFHWEGVHIDMRKKLPIGIDGFVALGTWYFAEISFIMNKIKIDLNRAFRESFDISEGSFFLYRDIVRINHPLYEKIKCSKILKN